MVAPLIRPVSSSMMAIVDVVLPGTSFSTKTIGVGSTETRSGASLTALTVMLTVSVSVSGPPAPVLPWSLVVICRLARPLKLAVGREAQAVQGGVDVGEGAGEGHRRVGGAVAGGEAQAGELLERERAVGGGQRDLKRVPGGVDVGDRDQVAVAVEKTSVRVFVD